MYEAYITTIKEINLIEGADNIVQAIVFGNSIVVGKDYKVGETVCYFPTDGQLSHDFCKVNNLYTQDGGYFDENRRVKTIRLRKTVSDGFVCKLDLLEKFAPGSTYRLSVGDRLTELGGKPLCQKYVPKSNYRKTTQEPPPKTLYGKIRRKVRKYIASFKPQKIKVGETIWFPKHSDTEQLQYNLHKINTNSLAVITSKLHGTSGRTGHVLHPIQLAWWKKYINLFYKVFPTETYQYISGSRNVLLNTTKTNPFYGDLPNLGMRKQAHNYFVGKLRKNEIVYYELVGYDGEKPIMPIHNTAKTNDKQFVRNYGEHIVYHYGCKPGQYKIVIYRIAYSNPDGDLIDLSWNHVKLRAEELGLTTPNEYAMFVPSTNTESFLEEVKKYANLPDPLGKHWSEGVTIRLDGSEWKCFKFKNDYFKIMEGIAKAEESDPEEES